MLTASNLLPTGRAAASSTARRAALSMVASLMIFSEAASAMILWASVGVGAVEPQHDLRGDVHLLERCDDPAGDVVAADDARRRC